LDSHSTGAFSVPSPLTAFVLIGLALLLHAFFTTAEIALITLRKTRLRQLVEEKNPRALQVERLLSNPTRLIAITQISTILTGTFTASVAVLSLVPPFAAWLVAHSRLLPPYATGFALLLVLLPTAILSLIVGEIAPKSLVGSRSERLALLVARPIRFTQILLAPAVSFVMFISNLFLRPFGGTASFMAPAVNEEELKMMVEASEEQGVLEAEETEMINSVIDFSNTIVRKVMTPRIDMTGVPLETPLPDLVRSIEDSGHSRIPIYEGDMDNIVGIVLAKDLLPLLAGEDKNDTPLKNVMRAPYFIPETKKLAELLAEFRRTHQQIAVVRDEYGITSGIITLEDLLEEIVGDIQDEYDTDEQMIVSVDSHSTIFDGRTGLDDVNDRMGLELPDDEADTLGGFVFGLLGHQAERGEQATWGGTTFVVEETDGRRITRVRLLKLPPEIETPSPKPERFSPESNGQDSNRERRYVEVSGVETAPDALVR